MGKITKWLEKEEMPGFRSGSKFKMAIATIGYILFLSVIVTAIFSSYIFPIPEDQITNPTSMPGLPTKEPIPSPSPIPTSTPLEVIEPKPTPSPTLIPTPTTTLLYPGRNKWYTVDDFKVCVRDVWRLSSIELMYVEKTVYPKDDDHQFLAISIIIRNVGDVDVLNTPSDGDAYILDLQNKVQYESTRKGSHYKLGPAYYGNTKIFPGIEEEGIILFEISEEAKRDLRFVLKIGRDNYHIWKI